MLSPAKIKTSVLVAGVCLFGLTGCDSVTHCCTTKWVRDWSSSPVVVEHNFGNSVRSMVKNQTLYPQHGQNDRAVLGLDGQKAQGVMRDYRDYTPKKIDKVKKTQFSNSDVSGGL